MVTVQTLRRVRELLGVDPGWVREWEGGFTWWPGGFRQDIGRPADRLPQDPRVLVTTRLGALGVNGRGIEDLAAPMRCAVLAGVTALGQSPGVASFVSAYSPCGDDVDKFARRVAVTAAVHLVLRREEAGRGWAPDDIVPEACRVPREAVDRVLGLCAPCGPARLAPQSLVLVRGALEERGLTVADRDGKLHASATHAGDWLNTGYDLTLDPAARHPLFGPGVGIEVGCPRLVPAVSPVGAAAALTALARANPDSPDVAGRWLPAHTLRYAAFVPAALVTDPEDLVGHVRAALGQVTATLLVSVETAGQAGESLRDWFGRFASERREGGGCPADAALPLAVSVWQRGRVPDDAEEVARAYMITLSGGIPVTWQVFLAREDGPEPTWALWSRCYDDSLLLPIGYDPDDALLARCPAAGVSDCAAAHALLARAWERGAWAQFGVKPVGDVVGGRLLPTTVAHRLFDEMCRPDQSAA